MLHKASPRRKDRTSAGQGKSRKRNKLSPRLPQSAKKQEESTDEECDRYLSQQQQIEAFDIVWTKIESTIKVI